VFFLLYPAQPYFLIAALAGFIGHCWPIFYRLKGGRGISPFYGGLFGFDPLGQSSLHSLRSSSNGDLKRDSHRLHRGVFLIIFWFLLTKMNNPLFPYYMAYAILINILFILQWSPRSSRSSPSAKNTARQTWRLAWKHSPWTAYAEAYEKIGFTEGQQTATEGRKQRIRRTMNALLGKSCCDNGRLARPGICHR